jgi:hypothetical protein
MRVAHAPRQRFWSGGWSYAGAPRGMVRAPMTRNSPPFALTVAVGLIAASGCGGTVVGSGVAAGTSNPCTGGNALPTGVLATGQHMPSGLVVDCANVYWINLGTPPAPTGGKSSNPYTDGQVMKCAIAGCDNNPTVLASGRLHGLMLGPMPIALDATSVYWDDITPLSGDPTFVGHLFKCSISSCNDTPTVLAPGFAYALSVDGSSAYWTTYDQTQIMGCPVGGCASPSLLASLPSNEFPAGIAVDGTNIYWAIQLGGVMKCAINGCSSSLTSLVAGLRDPTPGITPPGGGPASAVSELGPIALDDTNVYVVDTYGSGLGRILKCAKSGCNNSPTTLASGLSGATGVAVDANNVYWTEAGDSVVAGQMLAGAGRVAKCAVSGCNDSPTVIAANQDGPTGIAVDATHVYWATYGGNATDGKISVAAK